MKKLVLSLILSTLIPKIAAFTCEVWGVKKSLIELEVDPEKLTKENFTLLGTYEKPGLTPLIHTRCRIVDLDEMPEACRQEFGEICRGKTTQECKDLKAQCKKISEAAQRIKDKAKRNKVEIIHSCWTANPICPDRASLREAVEKVQQKIQEKVQESIL